MKQRLSILLLAVACAIGVAASAQTSSVTLTRVAELRADKLPAAPVLDTLASGAPVRVLSLEGGWALVEAGRTPPRRGWVRAGVLNLPAQPSAAVQLASGREASGNTALTLGVRSLAPRANRHALIIGISEYADAAIAPLPGASIDRQSATQMAQAMQVPLSNIRYLQNEQATGDGIRKALRDLDGQVQEGDRVFIHFSGHGTRFNDPAAGGCVEALLGYDGGAAGTVTNREMADLLRPITHKTDKLFVMYDACHSGGVIAGVPLGRTRGFSVAGDEGLLRAKFTPTSEECGRPVNVKTRNLLVESTDKGILPLDIVHVSSSRDNEISFDDELKGGLATQFMRDCMLRDAQDLDGSGAISIDEVRMCAQDKINKRMQNDANFKPHHIALMGNAGFVPAWFAKESLQPVALAAAAPTPTAPAAAPALTGEQALRQMFDQRDAKRGVQVELKKPRLRIGQDTLDLSVRSDHAGYLYVAMAGSDNQSLYLLYPNDLDGSNRIEAGRTVQLPGDKWRIRASGPAGRNNLLVLVADGPRDLSPLAAARSGPFMKSLNTTAGRADLGALMTRSRTAGEAACAPGAARTGRAECSDAFGAALVTVEEFE